MSKAISGLFHGTLGEENFLEENYYARYSSEFGKVVDIKSLPGSKGIELSGRLSPEQMKYLTEKYGVEFALVYKLGPGKNGRGGQYHLFSGSKNSVSIPMDRTTILISHTHPGGTAQPSRNDMRVMALLASKGSPQKVSAILPSGKEMVKFSSKGLKRDY